VKLSRGDGAPMGDLNDRFQGWIVAKPGNGYCLSLLTGIR
jgi:hypothetical protein